MIDVAKNNTCKLTNLKINHISTWKNFPVFAGCVHAEQNISHDFFEDINWNISECGVIQIYPLPSLDKIYLNNHNDSVGQTWKEHHFQFSEFIKKYSPKNVLEIGGASGKLFDLLKESNLKWTIIEPNPIKENYEPARLIKKFFSEEDINEQYDCIVHSHFFEHLQYPQVFMNNLLKCKNNTLHIFSIPNQKIHLQQKYSNCLFFEHSFLAHEHFVDIFLQKNKFKILEKKYYTNHSIFYASIKDDNIECDIEYPNLYENNLKLFHEYENSIYSLINKINNVLSLDVETYIFGAHIFAQVLLNRGLNYQFINGIIDNSPAKINKRLYGTNLIVHPADIVKEKKFINVILSAGVYNNEIKSQLLNLNENINFIEM